ncbi:MAG: flavin reductase family protein [Lachnospiraceae bacterium]|nr:flavin reductase family protein [Lachnospiraceae bacterium]
MPKTNFKPGNMLYPVPAVMVSCGDINGLSNIITVAWTGTICTNPPMLYISVRPERFSYNIIKNSGEFIINLTNEKLAYATDFCGVRSGRDTDKWKLCNLTKETADTVKCPMIKESPVNIECHVKEIKELGSHHMFIADVTAVHADTEYIDESNKFHLDRTGLIAYSHGSYFSLGRQAGTFGFSVKKAQKQNRRKSNK